MGNTFPLDYNKTKRPSFERMITDLQDAKRMWDILPYYSFNKVDHLQSYSVALLKLVGMIAAEEAMILMEKENRGKVKENA